MSTPRFLQAIPSYIRFTPAEAARKIRLLSRKIEDMGDDFSEAALVEYEIELTEAILKEREKPRHEASPTQRPIPATKTDSWRPLRPSKWPSDRLPQIDFWISDDTPILVLSDRWVLATDWELQWVIYRRSGKRWRAEGFPTCLGSLLWYLEHWVDHVTPEALAEVRSWPRGPFSKWRTSTIPPGDTAGTGQQQEKAIA